MSITTIYGKSFYDIVIDSMWEDFDGHQVPWEKLDTLSNTEFLKLISEALDEISSELSQ
jgi:hypothetical protein